MPTFTTNFVPKKCVFNGFALDLLYSKAIISLGKFYELYFDIVVMVEWWSSIMWDSLYTKYIWTFKAGIIVASLHSIRALE